MLKISIEPFLYIARTSQNSPMEFDGRFWFYRFRFLDVCYVRGDWVRPRHCLREDWAQRTDDLSNNQAPALVLPAFSMRLTHWGRVTHICVGKLTIIDSYNGLSPGRRQAIIWINAGILLIGSLGTNFIFIQENAFKKNIFIQENAFENVVWEIASILSRPQWSYVAYHGDTPPLEILLFHFDIDWHGGNTKFYQSFQPI